MAKKTTETVADKLCDMRGRGVEQVLPNTNRSIRLRAVSAEDLLRENKMPDILTPLIIRSVYADSVAREIREFTTVERGDVASTLEMIDSIDFIVKKAIADDTKVSDLTLPEKKWIFQLVLGPAEILANFRLKQDDDVETVAEGEDLREAAE